MISLTARQRFLLEAIAADRVRVSALIDDHWSIVPPHQSDPKKRQPSGRESRRLLDAGLVRLVPRSDLGIWKSANGRRYPVRLAQLAWKGRRALDSG